jgi:signal transduction histidine kinase
MRPLAADKHIRMGSAVDSGCARLVVDISRLKQILFNYLSNAIKFTPEGGRVDVTIRPESANWVTIAVRDTGVGIRTDDLPLLFEQFQQLDGGKGKRHQGTGLGLALVKRITEAQGGSVDVESVWGKGSTFYVRLPRIAPATVAPVGNEAPAAKRPA